MVDRLRENFRPAEAVFGWMDRHQNILEISLPDEMSEFMEAGKQQRQKFRGGLGKEALRAAIRVLAPYNSIKRPRTDVVSRNAVMLGKELRLSRLETDFLCLLVHCKIMSPLDRLADDLMDDLFSLSRVAGWMLGVNRRETYDLFLPNGALSRSGIFTLELGNTYFANSFSIPDCLKNTLSRPARSIIDLREGILGKACSPGLAWEDFSHIGYERDITARILKGALCQESSGVNILLYGPPGTGKTELAKSLAQSVCSPVFSIAETDSDNGEPSRQERLSQLKLAQRLLKNNRRSILLFDEMEDLQCHGHFAGWSAGGSKVFLNRMLEENEVPTIWAANDLDGFDPAMLRRFTAVIEIPVPTARTRERIWKKLARDVGIRLDDRELKRLAAEVKAAPGVMANAVKAAKLAGGGVQELRYVVHGMAKAMSGGHPVRPVAQGSGEFRADLANVDPDLGNLVNHLCQKTSGRNFSLCLYGPPGTGKSMFARHLAKELDMEVLQKRASDLMSMWVGGTERNIAQAFAEARRTGSFLIFDEADSLLGDRRSAQASWEISQVNEMLTWMESHELPFVCTTNLSEALDQASLRRFTFKLHFRFLSGDRLAAAFRHFFGNDAPCELLKTENLTAGDFAVVRKRATFTGDLDNRHALVKMLKLESDMKEPNSKPIGFGAAL